MTDRPILFNAPMVRAILREIEQPDTGKTQTRRVIAGLEGGFDAIFCDDGVWYIGDALTGVYEQKLPVRYRVGDRLHVREAWRCEARYDAIMPRDIPRDVPVYYGADPDPRDSEPGCAGKLRPSMFMPRWASRITLIVTGVRVERLQDISRDDAIAEGLSLVSDNIEQFWRWPEPHHEQLWLSPVAAYQALWDSINAARGYGWDANPWVAAYSFRPTLGNIDNIKEAA